MSQRTPTSAPKAGPISAKIFGAASASPRDSARMRWTPSSAVSHRARRLPLPRAGRGVGRVGLDTRLLDDVEPDNPTPGLDPTARTAGGRLYPPMRPAS